MPINYTNNTSSLSDSGENQPASISPIVDGVDDVNANSTNRPTNNLRNRTEVLRSASDQHEAILTKDLGMVMWVDNYTLPAYIHWDGAGTPSSGNIGTAGSGAVYIDTSATLHIAPVANAASNILAAVQLVNYGDSITSSGGCILTSNWLDYQGGNTIEVQVSYTLGLSTPAIPAVSVSGGATVGIPLDINPLAPQYQRIINVTIADPAVITTTWQAVGNAINGYTDAEDLVTLTTYTPNLNILGAAAGNTDFAQVGGAGPYIATYNLIGGIDAERHEIASGQLNNASGTPRLNARLNTVGDSLFIAFPSYNHRRQQTLTNAVSAAVGLYGATTATCDLGNFSGNTTSVTYGMIFSSSTVPPNPITPQAPNAELYCLPIGHVGANGQLILANGQVIAAGGKAAIGGYHPQISATGTNPLANTVTVGPSPGASTDTMLLSLATDLANVTASAVYNTAITNGPAAGSVASQLTSISGTAGGLASTISTFANINGSFFTAGSVNMSHSGSTYTITAEASISAFINGIYYSSAAGTGIASNSTITTTSSGTYIGVNVSGGNLAFTTVTTSNWPTGSSTLWFAYIDGSGNYWGPGQLIGGALTGAPATTGRLPLYWAINQPIKVGPSTATGMTFTTLDDAVCFLGMLNAASGGDGGDHKFELQVFGSPAAWGTQTGAASVTISNTRIISAELNGATFNIVGSRAPVTGSLAITLKDCEVDNIIFALDGSSTTGTVYESSIGNWGGGNVPWYLVNDGSLMRNCIFEGGVSSGTNTYTMLHAVSYNYHAAIFEDCYFQGGWGPSVAVDAPGSGSAGAVFRDCFFTEGAAGIAAGQTSPSNTATPGVIHSGALAASSILIENCTFTSTASYAVFADANSTETIIRDSTVYNTVAGFFFSNGGSVFIDNLNLVAVNTGAVNIPFAEATTTVANMFLPVIEIAPTASNYVDSIVITNCTLPLNRNIQAAVVITKGGPGKINRVSIHNNMITNAATGTATNPLGPLVSIYDAEQTTTAVISNNTLILAQIATGTSRSPYYVVTTNLQGAQNIWITDAKEVRISNNTVHSEVIEFNGAGNLFSQAQVSGSNFCAPAIYVAYINGSGVTITGNTITYKNAFVYDLTASGAPTTIAMQYAPLGCGIYLPSNATTTVSGNTFLCLNEFINAAAIAYPPTGTFSASAGIYITGLASNASLLNIQGNTFIGAGSSLTNANPYPDDVAIYLGGIQTSGGTPINASISNNTISNFQTAGIYGNWNAATLVHDLLISGNNINNCGNEYAQVNYSTAHSNMLSAGIVLMGSVGTTDTVGGIVLQGNFFSKARGSIVTTVGSQGNTWDAAGESVTIFMYNVVATIASNTITDSDSFILLTGDGGLGNYTLLANDVQGTSAAIIVPGTNSRAYFAIDVSGSTTNWFGIKSSADITPISILVSGGASSQSVQPGATAYGNHTGGYIVAEGLYNASVASSTVSNVNTSYAPITALNFMTTSPTSLAAATQLTSSNYRL